VYGPEYALAVLVPEALVCQYQVSFAPGVPDTVNEVPPVHVGIPALCVGTGGAGGGAGPLFTVTISRQF